MATGLTIRQLKNQLRENWFKEAYSILASNKIENLDDDVIIRLLKTGILFIHYGDGNLKRMGYKIILSYSIQTEDYHPLYDISLNLGYIPVSMFIENKILDDGDGFMRTFNKAFQEQNKKNGIYLSNGQLKLVDFAQDSTDDFVLVAPTSYGKSEIIVNEVYKDPTKKICVIVPSKALLAQTKKRIVEKSEFLESFGRIITHPDMYKGNEQSFISVLTQERLLRLLQKNQSLKFDVVLIDEAHNMLNEGNRSILITQVIMILKKRNQDTKLKFFTPFISSAESLKIPYSPYDLEERKVSEHIKIEQFYMCDLTTEGKMYIYDQFIDDYILTENRVYQSDVETVLANKASKNIVYINRPRDIQKFAKKLILNTVEINPALTSAISAIRDYVHPDYDLIKCLESGVVYHHGGMPENVRLYVENAFSTISSLEFIVTSSTLLEGVNIPAEKIFLLTVKIGRRNFSKSQFKNLIGRVCRFSEVFHPENGSLKLLEPHIYIIKGDYSDERANLQSFLKKKARIDIKFKDEVENVLLKQDDSNMSPEEKVTRDDSLVYVENIERDTVEIDPEKYASTLIGQLCFNNNVYDFDIHESEDQLNRNLNGYKTVFQETKINSPNELLNALYYIFIQDVNIEDDNLERLSFAASRNFYSMFIDWRTNGSSYNQMINQFTRYWSTLPDPVIYVGGKWGERTLNEYNFRELYVDLAGMSSAQKTNLAIVRIKEEQDYVDNTLMKFIEIINDLELINSTFYDTVKYGSSNARIIILLKNGFSIELAKLISSNEYEDYLTFNFQTDDVIINREILPILNDDGINAILMYELQYHMVNA
jgi:hypothetical protein